MNTREVASKLVEYCRTAQWERAQTELYAPNCVSIEPAGGAWPEKVEGMEAIIAKAKQFDEMVEEFHGIEVSEPIVYGNHFSCGMTMDVTYKGAPRNKSEEICVYEVADGKIVKEQFFYPMPPEQ